MTGTLRGGVRAARDVRRALGGAIGHRPPDFLILGAQKAGTTSLLDWLGAHPRIAPPDRKEVHWFTNHWGRPAAWYRSHFPRRPAGVLSAEATPYYLFHPAVPERVARALPDVRCIVLLRDPAARTISHHNHERALGFEDLELEAALAAERRRLAGAHERLAADPRARSFAHQHHSYLARSRSTVAGSAPA